MLSQIENGKSNPTVSTLWKISTALKVSFSFFIELEQGCNHISQPLNLEVEEYIIVDEGILELQIENQIFTLSRGQSIKFHANKIHAYKNFNCVKVRFHNIIFY